MSEVEDKYPFEHYESNVIKHEVIDPNLSILNVIDKIEFGLTSIKARITFIPKTLIQTDFFMKRIYIYDADPYSESEYKYLIMNPLVDIEE